MTRQYPILRPKTATSIIGCILIGGLVAGCGGGGSNGAQQSSVGSNAESGNGSAHNGQPSFARFAATSGKITGVGSAGATVQTSNGSKKVAFGTVTTFTLTSSTSRSGVAVGDCVRVTSASTTNSTVPTARPTASPGTVPTVPKSLTAKAVTITSTSSCPRPSFNRGGSGGPAGGFNGEGGPSTGNLPTPSFSPDAGGTLPNSAPGGQARSGFSGRGFAGGGFGGATGTVTSVNGSTIKLTSQFGTGTTTVTTTASTTYSVTDSTRASSVKTGQCLAAIGSTASDGTLDARTVSLSAPVNGTCANRGFGFGGGFGGPPGGGQFGYGASTSTNGGSGA
jgi:hypothetical protein